jgi:hypothetical protein
VQLQPLYAWFTDGFGFSELREANAELDALQRGQAKTSR